MHFILSSLAENFRVQSFFHFVIVESKGMHSMHKNGFNFSQCLEDAPGREIILRKTLYDSPAGIHMANGCHENRKRFVRQSNGKGRGCSSRCAKKRHIFKASF